MVDYNKIIIDFVKGGDNRSLSFNDLVGCANYLI